MTRFREKFREEREYLRRLAREHVKDYPELEPFLGDSANDPDVERLLESFAFLTARLRLKIDDDFPEISQNLLRHIWPNVLRPLPSATIIRFLPRWEGHDRHITLPKQLSLFSDVIQGVRYEFRTCAEVKLYPWHITDVNDQHTIDRSVVNIDMMSAVDDAPSNFNCDSLDFYFSGNDHSAQTLLCWITQYRHKILIHIGDKYFSLNPDQISFPGFDVGEALLPQTSKMLNGYRILQEYFWYPRRFYFFRLSGLRRLWPDHALARVRIECQFNRPMPDLHLTPQDVSLYCVPAINLFEHEAQSIRLTQQNIDLPLIPQGDPDLHEIFSVDSIGPMNPQKGQHDYPNFDSLQYTADLGLSSRTVYYRHRHEPTLDDANNLHHLDFIHADETPYVGQNETITVVLTCTNRNLPQQLGPGSITLGREGKRSAVAHENIHAPSPARGPLFDTTRQWELISNFSSNDLTLNDAAAIRATLGVYDFVGHDDLVQARTIRQRLEAIITAKTRPLDRVERGHVVRGIHTVLEIDGKAFGSEGAFYFFVTALSHYFASYATEKSFHRLEVRHLQTNESYCCPQRRGLQPLI